MAQQFTAVIASGSTNGKNIKISAISTPGTILHTAVSGTTSIDEIEVWVTNTSSSSVLLSVEYGGVTSPDDLIKWTIPPQDGPYYIIPGWRLQNSLVIRAFAAVADVLVAQIRVNRITA